MSGATPRDAILRQMRQVRRRHNAVTAQRVAYAAIGTAAVLAALVVLAALRGGRTAFGLALAASGVAGTVLLVRALRGLRRSWLAPAAAADWIDRTAALQARVATVATLPPWADGPFERLLVEQTHARLTAFAPGRLVPTALPGRALAGAVAGLAVLAAIVVLAPALRPKPRRLLVGERAADFAVAGAERDGADRVITQPGNEMPADPAGAADAAHDDTGGDAVAEATADLQDWVREVLWGDVGWDEAPAPDRPDGDHRARDEPARRRPQRGTQPRAGTRPGETAAVEDATAPSDTESAREIPSETPTAGGAPGDSGVGSGAGTGTDPSLYRAPRQLPAIDAGRFELAIAARVRTRPGTGRDAEDAAPVAEPDLGPALARQMHPEEPPHRMPIPAAWHDVVRRVFAHPPAAETAP